jgi:tetrahydromethanopterin S-methyltransferase subunit G
LEVIVSFWNDNYSSIMVSLGVGFVFFVLGPIGVWFSGRKIRNERVRKAKEMLIDLIEGMLVTQEKITTAKLKQLFNAVEREVETTIDSAYDLERLFEDVSLRFQRSKHLDSTQKDSYSNTLLGLADSLNQSQESGKRVIPRSYETLIAELRDSALSQDNDKLNKTIEELEEKISKIPEEALPFFRIIEVQRKMIRKHPIIFGLVIAGYIVFVILAISGSIK